MKTKVLLREEKEKIQVAITSDDKPYVNNVVLEKWQHIINLTAGIIDVPAGLIMKITEDSMKVFLRSEQDENPYPEDGADSLGHGLYCETVIGRDEELLVEDALNSQDWKDNPDVALDMIAYYGLPIKWPDQEFFGTICVLDQESNQFSESFKLIMKELRNSIEKDLELLVVEKELIKIAELDVLTGIFNRRKTNDILVNEYKRSTRSEERFSVALFDLDNFKQINDTYGHEKGDQVLSAFANLVKARIRSTDTFGRWGGDEFLLICPGTNNKQTRQLISDLKNVVCADMEPIIPDFSFSYGVAEYKDESSVEELLALADADMYKMKKEKN